MAWRPPYGFGKHVATLSAKELKIFMMGDYIFSHFYNFAIASTKLAILSLYYRIFSTALFRRIIIGTAVFIFLWICVMEITLGLDCMPVTKFWDASVKGSCLDLVAFSYFTNITNLLTDIWVFLLPMPIIFGLHITQRRKLELAAIFAIGLLCLLSVKAQQISPVCRLASGSVHMTDINIGTGVPLGILSVYEPLGGVVCANLPFIYRWMTGAVKKIISSFEDSESGGIVPMPAFFKSYRSVRKNRGSITEIEWSSLNGKSGKDTSMFSETATTQNSDIELAVQTESK
ncbi:hypothetical protein N7495_003042 [Penicillium taxi]|uniref:uncharacterized protein n=1 Tax=Penicillium taxi TaxID=168475 RepID=UPI002544EF91|nr:uncharacterized protein N7495_003042 [Penicillium taxi]KAJ5902514.1 hypothetical protein N7495_003042 [Penicillium taxi]